MEPGVSVPHAQTSLSISPILSRMNPILRIDTYFFKAHSVRHGHSKRLLAEGLPDKF